MVNSYLPQYLITVTGELPLRSSRTRPRFYRVLLNNIRDALERNGARLVDYKIIDAKIFVETNREAIDVISRVFGVHRVGSVLIREFTDLGDLSKWIYENSKDMVIGKKFAVRVKRTGVHSFRSIDVAREVGALLKPHSTGVDLDNPDVVIRIEIRGSMAYLYRELANGPGGLPIGVEGKALVLFSGGFDSPVAAWFSAKRGIMVDFLHYIMGSTQSSYYAFIVAREISEKWLYGYRPLFIVIDLRETIDEISRKIEWSYRQVVLRTVMYSIAAKIARSHGYDAIVTGESIGQAASQTLRNIATIEKTSGIDIPVLRPLIGLDREEIIGYSRRIGLYESSTRVIETCIIAPTRVATATEPGEIELYLGKLDQSVIDRALSSIRVLKILESSPDDVIPPSDIEIDFIPRDAVVLDARSDMEREKKPLEEALSYANIDLGKLPRDKTIVVVCETGSVSYFVAKTLREFGFKAYSLRGGIRQLNSPRRFS